MRALSILFVLACLGLGINAARFLHLNNSHLITGVFERFTDNPPSFVEQFVIAKIDQQIIDNGFAAHSMYAMHWANPAISGGTATGAKIVARVPYGTHLDLVLSHKPAPGAAAPSRAWRLRVSRSPNVASGWWEERDGVAGPLHRWGLWPLLNSRAGLIAPEAWGELIRWSFAFPTLAEDAWYTERADPRQVKLSLERTAEGWTARLEDPPRELSIPWDPAMKDARVGVAVGNLPPVMLDWFEVQTATEQHGVDFRAGPIRLFSRATLLCIAFTVLGAALMLRSWTWLDAHAPGVHPIVLRLPFVVAAWLGVALTADITKPWFLRHFSSTQLHAGAFFFYGLGPTLLVALAQVVSYVGTRAPDPPLTLPTRRRAWRHLTLTVAALACMLLLPTILAPHLRYLWWAQQGRTTRVPQLFTPGEQRTGYSYEYPNRTQFCGDVFATITPPANGVLDLYMEMEEVAGAPPWPRWVTFRIDATQRRAGFLPSEGSARELPRVQLQPGRPIIVALHRSAHRWTASIDDSPIDTVWRERKAGAVGIVVRQGLWNIRQLLADSELIGAEPKEVAQLDALWVPWSAHSLSFLLAAVFVAALFNVALTDALLVTIVGLLLWGAALVDHTMPWIAASLVSFVAVLVAMSRTLRPSAGDRRRIAWGVALVWGGLLLIELGLGLDPGLNLLLRADINNGERTHQFAFKHSEINQIVGSYRMRPPWAVWPPRLGKSRAPLRILCMGGSQTKSVGVNRSQNTWPAWLARELNGCFPLPLVETVNGGQEAHTSFDILLALRRELDAVQPDLVLVSCGPNDSWPSLFAGGSQRQGYEAGLIAHYSHSILGDALRSLRLPAWIALESQVLTSPGRRSLGAIMVPPDDYRRNLREIVALTRERGLPLVFIFDPTWPSLPPSRTPGAHYREILRDVAEETTTLWIDGVEMAAAWDRDAVWVDGIHLNALGNRRFAQAVANSIQPVVQRHDRRVPIDRRVFFGAVRWVRELEKRLVAKREAA